MSSSPALRGVKTRIEVTFYFTCSAIFAFFIATGFKLSGNTAQPLDTAYPLTTQSVAAVEYAVGLTFFILFGALSIAAVLCGITTLARYVTLRRATTGTTNPNTQEGI